MKETTLKNCLTNLNNRNIKALAFAYDSDLNRFAKEEFYRCEIGIRFLDCGDIKNRVLEILFMRGAFSRFLYKNNASNLVNNFQKFLRCIVRNVIRRESYVGRKYSERYPTIDDEETKYKEPVVEYVDMDKANEILIQLKNVRNSLSNSDKKKLDILIRNKIEGVSVKNISKEYGIEERAVYLEIFRIREKLKGRLCSLYLKEAV